MTTIKMTVTFTTIKMTADTSIIQFINLDYKFYIYLKLSAKMKPASTTTKREEDHVKNYAHMVVDLGLIYKERLHISKQPDFVPDEKMYGCLQGKQ